MGMALDELTEVDEKIEVNGIGFIYKVNEEMYLNNSIIDYRQTYSGKEFTIKSSDSSAC